MNLICSHQRKHTRYVYLRIIRRVYDKIYAYIFFFFQMVREKSVRSTVGQLRRLSENRARRTLQC